MLNRVNIRLRSKLSDIFGKAGMEILNGLMAGKTVEAILEHTGSKQLKSRCEEIKAVAKGALSENDIFVIKHLTDTIEHLNGQIRDVEARIELIVNLKAVEIVSSILGVGKWSAVAILAEVGDAKRFSNSKWIVSWGGLVPSLHQSAGLTVLGSITKQGSSFSVEKYRAAIDKKETATIKASTESIFKRIFVRILLGILLSYR